MGAQIGLMGGTFDPVHNGHLSIARSFIDSGLLDELRILLTPKPPHKQQDQLTEYSLRYRMLEAAFKNVDDASISDVEYHLPQPAYTIQTIEHLREQEPEASFFLCIGEDSLRDFHTWYRYGDILKHVELIVAKRPGVDVEEVADHIRECTHFIDHDTVDISSTEIRKRVNRGQQITDLVPGGVEEVIMAKDLYKSK